MYLLYEKYIQRNCGNSFVKSYEKKIACLRKKLYTHKGSVQKNICSYFVSLRQGRGGGGHTKIIVSQLTNLSKCLSRFFVIFFVLRTIPQNRPHQISHKIPPKRGDFDDFFPLIIPLDRSSSEKTRIFSKTTVLSMTVFAIFLEKTRLSCFFFNVHSLEHFDHFLLPPKNRSFASWFVA